MTRLARALHCVPATSMPCERAFSVAGATHTARRASLGQHMIDDLTFLAANPIRRKDLEDFMELIKAYCSSFTAFVAE